jgi:hypothetical protein
MTALKIFIGTSDANRIEERVLVRSIERTCRIPYEIYLLNGDSGIVRGPDRELQVTVREQLRKFYVTRFTAMRFEVPKICDYQGYALYIDSDQLAFADFGELVRALPADASFGAVPVSQAISSPRFRRLVLNRVAPPADRSNYYLASVVLTNNARCRFDTESIGEALVQGTLPYDDLIWLGPRFRELFQLSAAAIDPAWNSLDSYEPGRTKLIHFTDLSMQPWRHPHNPTGRMWRKHFLEAVQAGAISATDLEQQRALGRLSWATLARARAALGMKPAPEPIIKLVESAQTLWYSTYWSLKVAAIDVKRGLARS